MNMVTLGNTGLKVSAISFGGIPIQRSDAANTLAVVDELEKFGINFIDTARGYTVSEEYLGKALKGRRDKFILATKSMSRSREAMAKDIDISLGNLQTDYIDLYQIHNLPAPTGPMRPWPRPRQREKSATSGPPPTPWTPCACWWRSTPTRLRR